MRRNGKKFKGLKVTPENRLNLIRDKQIDLIADGVDPHVAEFIAKKEIRREQKHLKAFIKGKTHYRYGSREEEFQGRIVKVPEIFKVL